MNIGLHGSYYGRNFGDTLILNIIKNWIEEASPNSEIILPFVTSEQEAIEILGKPSSQKKIKELDGLIFGPGGYFGEPPGSFLNRFRWALRNYKRHLVWNNILYKNNIPYIIVGVGVGPLSFFFSRSKVVKLFNNAKRVSVRDKYSKEYLVKWGVKSEKIIVTGDVALTLKPDINLDLDKVKSRVAIHFPGMNLENEGKLQDFIKFITFLQRENDVFLLEDQAGQFGYNKKHSLKKVFEDHGLKIDVIQYINPNTLINNLQKIDLIITSKLHVGIVGYALGKKILSIPKHSKTVRFFEQIEQEKFCIPFQTINFSLLMEKYEELKYIDNSYNNQYNIAIKNKEIVFEFIKGLSE